jgi:hypothetical protein
MPYAPSGRNRNRRSAGGGGGGGGRRREVMKSVTIKLFSSEFDLQNIILCSSLKYVCDTPCFIGYSAIPYVSVWNGHKFTKM